MRETVIGELWIFEKIQVVSQLVNGKGRVKVSNVGDVSRGWPEGSFFNSYYTEVCSTLTLILTLKFRVKQGGIKYHFLSLLYGIELRSPRPLVNTLFIWPMARILEVVKPQRILRVRNNVWNNWIFLHPLQQIPLYLFLIWYRSRERIKPTEKVSD